MAQLQSTIDEMDAEAADQIEYTDMCKSLARLLRVDVGSSAATTAREIYHKVDTLLSEVENLKKMKRELEDSRQSSLTNTVGWSDALDMRPTLTDKYSSTYTGSLTSGSDLDRIRKSLVKQKLEYDNFVHEVSTALGVPKVAGEKANTAILVQRIVELMSEAPPPGNSSGSGKHSARPPPRSPMDSSRGGRHTREHRKQHEDLQRRCVLAPLSSLSCLL